MPTVFISYRRDDTRADAGRLHDHFVRRWGADRVFMDIDSIPGGSDFAKHIQDTLARRPIVIVLIGKVWLTVTTVTNESGGRRLHDPNDLVRIEVALALSKGLKVIPVLVGGARMPTADELPQDLHRLLDLNAREISDRHFTHDLARLIRDIDQRTWGPFVTAFGVIMLVALTAWGIWFLSKDLPRSPPTNEGSSKTNALELPHPQPETGPSVGTARPPTIQVPKEHRLLDSLSLGSSREYIRSKLGIPNHSSQRTVQDTNGERISYLLEAYSFESSRLYLSYDVQELLVSFTYSGSIQAHEAVLDRTFQDLIKEPVSIDGMRSASWEYYEETIQTPAGYNNFRAVMFGVCESNLPFNVLHGDFVDRFNKGGQSQLTPKEWTEWQAWREKANPDYRIETKNAKLSITGYEICNYRADPLAG